tara:strand:+ start:483 stop:728 length:246 start_codon:yes stop_codon:yes gene_type:complete
MNYNESSFKRLGFRKKQGEKNIITADAEVFKGEYITVDLLVLNDEILFNGIEITGKKADDIRKKYLVNYSLEEITKLFTDY